VLKFDHHCIWINQCVGYYNYKWFLSFLLFHAMVTLYGFVIGCGIIFHLIESRRLMEMYYIDMNTG
jgi:palmitoyltransferase